MKKYTYNALEPISCCFDLFAQSNDDLEEDYQFIYNDQEIGELDTPISLGMTSSLGVNKIHSDNEFIVKAVHKDKVKVTLLHSNGDAMWNVLILKSVPLLGYFNEFATEHLKDVARKDLVFSTAGSRLYGFDTAVTLKLKDGDFIDATPVKEYVTEGCACCQKQQNPLGL